MHPHFQRNPGCIHHHSLVVAVGIDCFHSSLAGLVDPGSLAVVHRNFAAAFYFAVVDRMHRTVAVAVAADFVVAVAAGCFAGFVVVVAAGFVVVAADFVAVVAAVEVFGIAAEAWKVVTRRA